MQGFARVCRLTRAASLGSGVDEEHSRSSDQSLHDLLAVAERLSPVLARVFPVNNASGVIARSLSNELKDAFNDGCISDKSVLDRVVC